MLTQTYQLEQTGSLVVATLQSRELSELLMQELAGDLMSRLRCDSAVYFVLDLARVEFMSSACLGILVMFLQDLEHVRGRLALCHCHPNVAFLFRVTKLNSVFAIHDDVAEAMAKVVKGSER